MDLTYWLVRSLFPVFLTNLFLYFFFSSFRFLSSSWFSFRFFFHLTSLVYHPTPLISPSFLPSSKRTCFPPLFYSSPSFFSLFFQFSSSLLPLISSSFSLSSSAFLLIYPFSLYFPSSLCPSPLFDFHTAFFFFSVSHLLFWSFPHFRLLFSFVSSHLQYVLLSYNPFIYYKFFFVGSHTITQFEKRILTTWIYTASGLIFNIF